MMCVRGQDVASGGGGHMEGSHGGLWDEGIPLSKSIISATSSSGLGADSESEFESSRGSSAA